MKMKDVKRMEAVQRMFKFEKYHGDWKQFPNAVKQIAENTYNKLSESSKATIRREYSNFN